MKNKVNLTGRFGRDMELKTLPNGTPVLSNSLATSRYWTDKESGEKKEETTWHAVVFYRRDAENVAKFMKKGSLVDIEGRLRNRNYEKDGQTIYVTEVVAEEVRFIPTGNNDSSVPAAPEHDAPPVADDIPEEIPQ
ncbi:single-strand binding protein [Advenella incenata]|uniref:Single-stranded DNA-binding protein n=1 Tax=Advenella incenata TaxID=267800 RepID=A0A4Q7V7A6_9BURK|nr:single-stranded DNA-binding protein [Advenella incenata]RZT91193.1 single-strand binding protein [Advenella incenata]